jgi:hypothetical protein
MKVQYIVSGAGTIHMVANGECLKPVLPSHPNYKSVCKLLSKGGGEVELRSLAEILDVPTAISKVTHGKITIEDGTIKYDGHELHNSLTDKLYQLMSLGYDTKPLLTFLDNLMQNPSNNSVNQLYNFLGCKNLPITDDGCFLAYKAVTEDYLDKWTKKIDNHVGETVTMPRNMVYDQPDSACANGLHCGSMEYVRQYGCGGDHYIVIKVNPKDAVSVPIGEIEKMRVCEYTVVYDMNDNVYDMPGMLFAADGHTKIEPQAFAEAPKGIFDNPAAAYWEEDDPQEFEDEDEDECGWDDEDDYYDNNDENFGDGSSFT